MRLTEIKFNIAVLYVWIEMDLFSSWSIPGIHFNQTLAGPYRIGIGDCALIMLFIVS
jgi:hypothetical protein